MSMISPQRKGLGIVNAFIREARSAGWTRTKCEIKVDGTVAVETSMLEAEPRDDFLAAELRLGK